MRVLITASTRLTMMDWSPRSRTSNELFRSAARVGLIDPMCRNVSRTWCSAPRSGEQRGDGGAAVEAEGPAEHVADLLRGVDADLAVDGRGEVGGGVTGGGGIGADLVGGAQDEAGAGAATGDQRGEDAAPVVAPGAGGVGDGGLLADARGAAELAGDDQEDVVGQAAGVEVFDQGGDAAVEGGEQGVLEGREVVVVRVPVVHDAEVDLDEAHPGLDQSAGQEEALAHEVAAVAVAEPGVFAGEVEGVAGPSRRQEGHGLVSEVVEPGHFADPFELAAAGVDLGQEVVAGAEAGEAQALGEVERGGLEARVRSGRPRCARGRTGRRGTRRSGPGRSSPRR